MDLNEKMIQLEIKISYLENDLQELNHIVIDQDRLISKLTAETAELRGMITGGKEEEVPQEKPPHY